MKARITAVVALTVAGIYFWPKNSGMEPVPEPASRSIASTASAPAPATGALKASAVKQNDSEKPPKLAETALEENEKNSIATLLGLFSRPDEVGSSPRALFDALGQAGLRPVAAKDSNEFTGTLWTVRTENALPGTRYFHAQLFGEGDTHMQHVSFEIRPGTDSMNIALDLVRRANPDLGRPEIEREDYVLWKKENGKVISVKRLNAEELRENRFNAHAPEDVGTIWVTSEDEPSHELAQF